MEISLDWLARFVDLPPLGELCDKLESAGVEVDAVDDPVARIRGVVVGEVVECGPHPDANKLKVCQVADGTDSWSVVCGAPNVARGQKVPLARVGAELGGMRVTERTLRGVNSRGMICSRQDLGLEQKSDGIWVLPEESEAGKDIILVMEIAPVLSLGITPNRPDLLSHFGVAREVAAATGQRVRMPNWRVSEKGPEVGVQARLFVEDQKGCDRYVARVIQGLTVGPSPAWLRTRLERVGQRSVNNIVDATNYVLFELGQPLHAFDLARLGVESNLPTIRVRRARPGETLVTLDDVERQLDPEDLIIADGMRPVALAGVMGGGDSEVSDATTAVLLESAHFDPVSVRWTAKRHGLHTESSHRFERGADPAMVGKAADRCAQILNEIAGGIVCKGVLEVATKQDAVPTIELRLNQVRRLLGITVPAEKVVELLEPLEIRCATRNELALHFAAPSFRPDLKREADLIEEVARRHGYDKIPESLPDASGPYRFVPSPRSSTDVARSAMLAAGCTEVVTYGFGNPAAYAPFELTEGKPLILRNPLGEDLSAMRTSLLPGLINVVRRNQRHGAACLRIFEIGRTFHPVTVPPVDQDERDVGLPREDTRIGCILAGGRYHGRWYEAGDTNDFADLAGTIEALVEAFDPAGRIELKPTELSWLNPRGAAEVWVGDVRLGIAGHLHPAWVKDLEVIGNLFAAEIDLAALGGVEGRRIQHRPLPRYPGTRRDVAVIVDRAVGAETVRRFLADHAGGELGSAVVERVRLFDVYAGKPIPRRKISLGFAIDYRSSERTLTDEEVGRAFEGVLAALKTKFDLEIR